VVQEIPVIQDRSEGISMLGVLEAVVVREVLAVLEVLEILIV
jgi:hypothetical protein